METIEQRYRRYLENQDQMETEARAVVVIDPDDCLPNLLQQASEYLAWSQLATIAESQSEAMKQHSECLAAECREKAYAQLLAANDKSTDQRVKDLALRDPAFQAHIALRRKCDLFANKLKDVQFALLTKRDMLKVVGFRQSSELGFYPKDPEVRVYRSVLGWQGGCVQREPGEAAGAPA